MVRTHGAAYEHAQPLACGGLSSTANIVHTSVQLNESKGATVLDQIAVPNDDWNGMTGYLSGLQRQPSSGEKHKGHASPTRDPRVSNPVARASARKHTGHSVVPYREAAAGLDIVIFALSDDPQAEEKFRRFQGTNKNWYFTTKPNNDPWKIHRLHCSALDFNGAQKVTAKPKVCAEQEKVLEVWASRFGVPIAACTRCPKPK